MKNFNGTEKQIAWAQDIMADLHIWEEAYPLALAKIESEIEKRQAKADAGDERIARRLKGSIERLEHLKNFNEWVHSLEDAAEIIDNRMGALYFHRLTKEGGLNANLGSAALEMAVGHMISVQMRDKLKPR